MMLPEVGMIMAVQRKVFRIEEHVRTRAVGSSVPELATAKAAFNPDCRTDAEHDFAARARAQIGEARAFKADLVAIHEAIGRTAADMASLIAGSKSGAQASRVSRELAAIVTGTERATQAILQSAEEIDQSAHSLAVALKSGHEQGLAHDIQERVVRIFEVCNFQDLTGQRVSKAVTTLKFIEEHIDRLLEAWQRIEQFRPNMMSSTGDEERRFLNGPRLSGDHGHSTQTEVDRIFLDA
jgi:chemotaxis protein CheZ